MTKSLDVMNETIRNPKSLRQVNSQPGKPRRHRYERRKIKEYLRVGNRAGEEAE